tara:strand:- start:702 stop:1133 length:432 start_codon:yes stop_codon:yes gene_type:complete
MTRSAWRGLASLPDELLSLALSNLGQVDMARSSRTCKAWRDATALMRLRFKRRFFAIYNDDNTHFCRWWKEEKWVALEDGIRFQITARQATELAREFLTHPAVQHLVWNRCESEYFVQLLRLLMVRGFKPRAGVDFEEMLLGA